MYCPNPDCPDFLETGSHAEYVAGITVCPKCGAYLVDTPPEHPPDSMPDAEPTPDEQLEPVFESWDSSEIPIIRSLLEAAGVPFVIEGQERFDAVRGGRSAFRFNPRAGSVLFLVPSALAEDARALLEGVETEDPAEL
jgi:hypothetical protein